VKLARYACHECFMPDLAGASREEILRGIVCRLREKGHIRDEAGIVGRLLERESVQSTAVGGGVAIPHCFAEEVTDLIVTVARVPAGIPFDSFDGKPVQVIFLLVGNTREQILHLKALARIARLIRTTRFIERVAAATTVEEMVRALEEEEEKI
jgi:mannitol/fructose-specific phosphotransferase system IIA component (Ntr-type)